MSTIGLILLAVMTLNPIHELSLFNGAEMSDEQKKIPRQIHRKPDQTDQEWEEEVQRFLKSTAKRHESQGPNERMPATPDSWTHLPFNKLAQIPYRDKFSAAEFERLKFGLIPGRMEDKWFIYYAEGQLNLYRSWTGEAGYSVTLKENSAGGAHIYSAETDVKWLGEADTEYHAALLGFLIGNLLLDRRDPFPRLPGIQEQAPGIYQHIISGTNYPEIDYDEMTQ